MLVTMLKSGVHHLLPTGIVQRGSRSKVPGLRIFVTVLVSDLQLHCNNKDYEQWQILTRRI